MALAEEDCGRWVECPESLSLSPGEYRAYIYSNTRDIEPWVATKTARAPASLILQTPAAALGVSEGAEEVQQARAIEMDPETGLYPGDISLKNMDVGQLILEAAPELSPEQIAQGISAAELYLKSINYREMNGNETAISFGGLDKNTGVESGIDGVTLVKPY